MTVDALLLEWIPCGGLPIYQLGEPGATFYQFREGDYWEERRTRDGRAWVSVEVDSVFPDFETWVPLWLEALDGLTEALGTLIFTIRSCFVLDGVRMVLAAMAFAPGLVVPTALPVDGADAADLIVQFCAGLAGEDSEQLHPVLREALRRELAHRAEWEAEMEVFRRQNAEAEAKSLELLEAYLKPEQMTEFRASGVFHVTLRDGRCFRFTKHFGHNVHLVENGVCTVEYCIIAAVRVPLFDQILAQKVLLEANTEEFFRIANFRVLRQPELAPPPPHPFLELANELAQV